MPSDSYDPKRLTRLAWLANITLGFPIVLPGAALPQIRADLGVGLSAGGWLIGIYSAGFFFGTLVGGALSERGRFRTAFLFASGVFVVAWGLVGRVPWVTANYALMAAAGLGAGTFLSVLNNLMIVLHGARSGAALNVLHAFISVSTIGGPLLLSGVLAVGGGWQDAFGLCVLLPAVVFVASLLERFPTESPSHGTAEVDVGRAATLLREPVFLLVCATMVTYIAAEFAVNVWLATYLTEVRGFPDWIGKSTVAAFWLTLALGRLITSRLVLTTPPATVLLGLGLTCLATYPLALLAGGHWISLALWVGFGLGCSGVFPTIFAVASERFPARTGAAVSLVGSSGTIGATFVPPLMGIVAEATTLAATMWLYLPFVVILTLTSLRLHVTSPARARLQTS